jgi:hypothetical protein
MAFRLSAVVCLALSTGAASATAAEICSERGLMQYTDSTRTCVSSMLAPQAGNSYGPDKLGGGYEKPEGAWCEGADGAGVGQSITLHQKPNNKIGSMTFVNGYARTADLFQANGRIKQALIETNSGYSKTITLKDTREEQAIRISPHKVSWLRLTILSVYPGTRATDTCVSGFWFNQEDFL